MGRGVRGRLPSTEGLQTRQAWGHGQQQHAHGRERQRDRPQHCLRSRRPRRPSATQAPPTASPAPGLAGREAPTQSPATPEKPPNFSPTESPPQRRMLRSHRALERSHQRAPESQSPPVPTQDVPLTTAAPQKVTQKPTPASPAPEGRQNHLGDDLLLQRWERAAKELHKPRSHASGARQQEFIFSRRERFLLFPPKTKTEPPVGRRSLAGALRLHGGSPARRPAGSRRLTATTGPRQCPRGAWAGLGQPSDRLSSLIRTGTPGACSYTPAALGNL